MSKIAIIGAVLICAAIQVDAMGDMGPGIWKMKYINKCEDASHKFKFDITKTRINRTHDGIDASLSIAEDFTYDFAIRIDICKEVDGGCKQYQVVSEDSLGKFVEKYAGGNVQSALLMAGIDPPEFPIPAGEYEIHDYIFNSEELPSEGPYGEFVAECFILKGAMEVGCVQIFAEFIEDEEE